MESFWNKMDSGEITITRVLLKVKYTFGNIFSQPCRKPKKMSDFCRGLLTFIYIRRFDCTVNL